PDVKGDVQIEARGASQLLVREQQQLRLTEFLQMSANPIDMEIIGPEGRAELLRAAVQKMDIPVDRIVPDRDKVLEKVRQQAMAEAQAIQAQQAQMQQQQAQASLPAPEVAPDATQFS